MYRDAQSGCGTSSAGSQPVLITILTSLCSSFPQAEVDQVALPQHLKRLHPRLVAGKTLFEVANGHDLGFCGSSAPLATKEGTHVSKTMNTHRMTTETLTHQYTTSLAS